MGESFWKFTCTIALCFLCWLPQATIAGNYADYYYLEKGEEAIQKNIMRRQATNQCPADECKLLSAQLVIVPLADKCQTRFCYAIKNLSPDILVSLNLFGVNTEGGEFKQVPPNDWKINSYGGLSLSLNQANSTTTQYCFELTGQYSLVPSKMFLNMGLYTCEKDVDVPGVRRDCAVDCVLDSNFANAQCQACSAACPASATVPSVTTVQTCTLKVLTTPNVIGRACTPQTTRTCTNTCPVDCSISGPLWEECKANCATPTVQQRGFYSTVVQPMNGGKACPVPTTATRSCSLDNNALFTSCKRDCVVTGIPTPYCPDLCKAATTSVFPITFTYPQTVVTPAFGGSACPIGTSTCTCKSCELFPFPFSTGECSATCSARDGSTATGLKRQDYSISVSGNMVDCTTTSYKVCYSSCACDFTTSSPLGECTVTSTQSVATPWVGYGIQKYTALGTAVQCRKTLDVSCSTTYTPVDCSRNTDCKGCSCTWAGTPYTLGAGNACTHSTFQPAMYGGVACPTTTFTQTCSQVCPGCTFSVGVCSCDYLTTSSLSGSTSVMKGTSKCVFPPASPHPLCTTVTTGYPSSSCSATVTSPVCVPNVLACDELCTTTSILPGSVAPLTATGFKSCLYSDTRALSDKPATCTSTRLSVIPCSQTVAPVDCTLEYACPTPSITCAPAATTSVATQTLSCSAFTVRTASFLGKCLLPPTSTSIVTSTCLPTPKPTSCLGVYTDYNLIVFGYARGVGSSIAGRVAILLDANFTSYQIGAGIIRDIQRCDINPIDAIVVGGSASISAQVYNGDVQVNGSCSRSTIISECDVHCGVGSQCNHTGTFDFPASYAVLKAKSLAFASLISTMNMRISDLNSQHLLISFSGALFEVFNVPNNTNINWWIFLNAPAPGSTVIFNVPGKNVKWVGLNLDILKTVQVIYNFYEADTVTIDAMDLPGTVFALDAIFMGSGTIRGSAFIRQLEFKVISPKFLYVPFLGKCAP